MKTQKLVKYFKRISIICQAAVLFALSCNGQTGLTYKTFWVFDTTKEYVTDSSAWYQITAVKKSESNNAVIYVDSAETGVSSVNTDSLLSEFESNIYSKVTQYFAQPLDADSNGKVTLLVFNIKDNYYYSGSGAYVGGYFFAVDMYSNSTVQAIYPAVHSNEADIVYIDCNPLNIDSTDAERTIAHEFQHLVNYSNFLNLKKDSETDTWIDEGLAEAAEHLCFGVSQDRIDFYNSDPSGLIAAGSPLFYWDSSGDVNVLSNYVKSYLFFQYMRVQSGSGNDIYKKILNSSYGDYNAIAEAMNGDSVFSTSTWGSTGTERFNRLVLRWYAANNLGLTSGIYSYGSMLSVPLTPHLYYKSYASGLLSGGGIVRTMSGNSFLSSSSFIYMSVSDDGYSDDFTSPYTNYNGMFVAVYNKYDTSLGYTGGTGLPASSISISETAENESISANTIAANMTINGDATKSHKIDLVVPKGIANGLKPVKEQ